MLLTEPVFAAPERASSEDYVDVMREAYWDELEAGYRAILELE